MMLHFWVDFIMSELFNAYSMISASPYPLPLSLLLFPLKLSISNRLFLVKELAYLLNYQSSLRKQ